MTDISPQIDELEDETPDKNYLVRGEIRLWQAVIVQAILDAKSVSTKQEDTRNRLEARVFLRGNTQHFVLACLAANLDPDYIRDEVKKVLRFYHD